MNRSRNWKIRIWRFRLVAIYLFGHFFPVDDFFFIRDPDHRYSAQSVRILGKLSIRKMTKRIGFGALLMLLLTAGIHGQSVSTYTITLEEVVLPSFPALQSFVIGTTDSEWLVIGGRKDGLHRRQPWATFQPEGNNTEIYVLNPTTGEVWSAGLGSLTVSLQEQLQSTNMEFFDAADHIVIIGGYGYSPTVDDHVTFPYLTFVDKSGLIQAVKEGLDIAPYFQQIEDDRFRVTGGYLGRIGDEYLLVGGQDFEGRYNPMGPDHGPGFFQEYTNAIQRFSITNDGSNIGVTNWQISVDSLELHRRDYNLVPQIFPDGAFGYTAFSGVFQYDTDLPWLNTVDITDAGYQVVPGFNQYLNQYHTAHAALYDAATQEMTTLFFGGIAQYYLNEQGDLVQDDNVPFVKTISCVTRDKNGGMTETLAGKMPDYLGASAEFIPNPEHEQFAQGILDIGAWEDGQAQEIGYILGGIQSSEANIFFTNEGDQSAASARVFRVMAQRISTSTDAVPRVSAEGYFQLKVHPNPASDRLHIYFHTHKMEWVQLALYDVQGKQVGPSFEGILDANRHEFEWKVDTLPSGTYFLRLQNEGEFVVEQMVVR